MKTSKILDLVFIWCLWLPDYTESYQRLRLFSQRIGGVFFIALPPPTAFYNLFGNMRAGQGALTIFNAGVNEFNGTIGEMENSLGATSKAYAKMEDTAEHAHKVFTNTADNLKIAIGESLSPMITGLYETGSDILKGITDFVKANPKLVGAVAAGASAVAVFAGGLVVYTIGAKAATAATAALTAAMDTNPIFLAITAIAALTVGAVALASAMDDSAEKGNQLTIESQKQQDEIADRQ